MSDELNELHRTIRSGQRSCVERAVAPGEALRTVRDRLPHGAWLPWVWEHLEFGDKTGRNYVSMAGHPDLAARCTSIRQFRRRIRIARHVERRRSAAAAGRALHSPDWCTLYEADFRTLLDRLPAGCASLCVADPVWDAEHLGDYVAADRVASHLLAPGGALLVYYPREHLPAVLAAFTRLRFVDRVFVVYTGPKQLRAAGGVTSRTLPVLLLTSGDRLQKSVYRMHDTRLNTVAGLRAYHRWEQDEPALRYWVECLTDPGDTVVDLCVGGGTLAAACHPLKGGTYHGCDTDPAALAATRKRLADLAEGESAGPVARTDGPVRNPRRPAWSGTAPGAAPG